MPQSKWMFACGGRGTRPITSFKDSRKAEARDMVTMRASDELCRRAEEVERRLKARNDSKVRFIPHR